MLVVKKRKSYWSDGGFVDMDNLFHRDVVKMAVREGFRHDPITDDDTDCWRWEMLDAVFYMNRKMGRQCFRLGKRGLENVCDGN